MTVNEAYKTLDLARGLGIVRVTDQVLKIKTEMKLKMTSTSNEKLKEKYSNRLVEVEEASHILMNYLQSLNYEQNESKKDIQQSQQNTEQKPSKKSLRWIIPVIIFSIGSTSTLLIMQFFNAVTELDNPDVSETVVDDPSSSEKLINEKPPSSQPKEVIPPELDNPDVSETVVDDPSSSEKLINEKPPSSQPKEVIPPELEKKKEAKQEDLTQLKKDIDKLIKELSDNKEDVTRFKSEKEGCSDKDCFKILKDKLEKEKLKI